MKLILAYMFSVIIATFTLHAMEQNYRGAERDIGTINFEFEQIKENQLVKRASPITIPAINGDKSVYTNYEGMNKTLLAIEMGNCIKTALLSFKNCQKESVEQEKIAAQLKMDTCVLEDRLILLDTQQKLEEKFFATIKMMNTLANNIAEYKEPKRQIYESCLPTMAQCAMERAPAVAASLNVTTGGAKDIGYFKKSVDYGKVPGPSDFPMEGFMSEFALAINGLGGNEYLAVHPVTAFNAQTNKLFIQIGLSTSVTPQNFKRKPLNLSFVVDISGSMSAFDGTDKSRLEWAKGVIDVAIANMNKDDIISIVVFDDQVETILSPICVEEFNKNVIKNSYAGLKPRGNTDLYMGLNQGFALVDKNKNAKFENRVILLSDAGTNTGYGTEKTLLRLISDNAALQDPIGLTAVGMGDNFKHELIHSISMGKGSNYLFVQSGKDLQSISKEFTYLVSPVAYNFKIDLMLNRDFKAKLIKAYGIPMKDGEPLDNIMNARSLFFTGSGGGAMVLEYQL